MAELMLLSEIADPTRFFTDNLLSPEDWGLCSEAGGRGTWLGPSVSMRPDGRKRRPRVESWAGRAELGAPCTLGGLGGGLPDSRLFPGVRDGWMDGRAEVLWLFGVTFQVGGRWVWPSRANEQWGLWAALPNRPPKSDSWHLLQTAPCTRAWMKWPRSPRSSFVVQSKMTRYDTPYTHPIFLPRVDWSDPNFGAHPQTKNSSMPSHVCCLFSSLTQFGSSSLDLGMDVSPPEPPWDALPIFQGKMFCNSFHPSGSHSSPEMARFPISSLCSHPRVPVLLV